VNKILIVDDSRDYRKVLRQHLENQEIDGEIVEAETGELAVIIALNEKPNIVLMDIWLPRMNGFTAAKAIKEKIPGCDVIMVTMFETEEFRRANQYDYITAFVGKSEVFDQLMPVLSKCLNERKSSHG